MWGGVYRRNPFSDIGVCLNAGSWVHVTTDDYLHLHLNSVLNVQTWNGKFKEMQSRVNIRFFVWLFT
jgi:hypothetical protein